MAVLAVPQNPERKRAGQARIKGPPPGCSMRIKSQHECGG